ncbi:MAG: hypothetical protein GWN56_02585 [Nitrosopumilaceae archaeon]|nr:hypothetical protein [Nitrosopumilaceae archaeon]
MASQYLANEIKPYLENFNSVHAIARGGFPLTTLILHQFNPVPDLQIRCIDISRYDSVEKNRYNNFNVDDLSNKSSLVIDDLIDQGKTLQKIHQHLIVERIWAVVMFVKPQGLSFMESLKPKIEKIVYWKTISQDSWVVFPWEQKQNLIYPPPRRRE